MRVRASLPLASLLLAAAAFSSAEAAAQQGQPAAAPPAAAPAAPPAAAPAAPPAATPASTPAASTARKDPEGKTGISPYAEQIAKGEAAFVARDVPGAIAAFQEAIKLDTSNMLGFYRLGEAMLASGNAAEAEAAWTTALGKKGSEDLQAKVLFCLSDLRERQKNWQAAKEAWTNYASFLSSNPKALGYPASAIERQKQIDRRVKDEKDYGTVKERIAQREAERQKEADENAKKDKLNR
jgi:predicted Zn-dependent protease